MRGKAPFTFFLVLSGAVLGCTCFDQGGLRDALPAVSVPADEGVEEMDRNSRYAIDFGVVELGDEEHRSFEIRNAGQASLEIRDISIEGPAASAYRARPPRLELAPNSVGRIEIAFTPLEEGEATASLLIDTNDDEAPRITVELSGTGYVPAIEVRPSTIDFGPVVLNDARTLPVQVENLSPEPLEAAVRGVQPSSMQSVFTVDWEGNEADGRVLLGIGETVELHVTYEPQLRGDHHAGFVIEPCPSCRAVTVSLTGRAVDSALVVEPALIEFGVGVPGHAIRESARFINVGSSGVHVESLALASLVSGPADPAFEIAQVDLPFTVEPGETVAVDLLFTPPDLESRASRLEWESSDPRNAEGHIPMTGGGGGPGIEVTPREILFGQVAVGTSLGRGLVISNPGYEENTISQVTLEDGRPSFSLTDVPPLPLVLQPGEHITVRVAFSPQAEGDEQESVLVLSDARHEPEARATLRGTGMHLGPCVYAVSPETLHFGNVLRDDVMTLPLAILNQGDDACLIRDLDLAADSAPEFAMAAGAADTLLLHPGEHHRVKVGFHPTTHGFFDGAVTFYASSAEDPDGLISLLGRSTQPDLALDPSPLDFGVVGGACPIRSRRFCVLNQGSVDATVTGVEVLDSSGDSAYALFDLPGDLDEDGVVVEPARRECFYVRFEPAETRQHLDVIHVHVAEKDYPLVLPLTGDVSDEGGDGGLDGLGCLHGRICGPSGDRWLPDADVLVPLHDDDGGFIDVLYTSTDIDGFFTLEEIPAGNRRVVIEKGSFHNEFFVDIFDGQITTLPEPECVRGDSARIAVIEGSFDSIEEVIARVGATDVTMYSSPLPLLGDRHALAAYDIVFINCGADVAPASNADVQSNLQHFVHNGGSLYASDYAYEYVDRVWPGKITFRGKQGSSGMLPGTVLDSVLASYLGTWMVMLNFNLGAWVVAESVDPSVERVVIGDVPLANPVEDAPLMVYFEHGIGRVVFTSFHNESQTTDDMDTILEYLVFRL